MEQLHPQQPNKEGALHIIDTAISNILGRDLMSTGEVTDILLDLRLCLVPVETN